MASDSGEITDRKADLTTLESLEFQRLRRSRSAAKVNIRKKIKELTEWKMSCQSLNDARIKTKEFADVVNNFYTAHSVYHAMIVDEYDIIDSDEYFQTERKRIENFTRTLEDWLASLESRRVSEEQDVKSTDSVSNVGRKSYEKVQ